MTISLILGALELVDKHGTPFAVEVLAEGTDWGNPQPVEVAIRSLLQDGSVVAHDRDENREVMVRVIITASDSGALAQGEEALLAELYRANTLTYTTGDGWAPATVFEVLTSSLIPTPDDLAEVRGRRTFSVRFVCRPFGRSVDEVAFTPTPTTVGGTSGTTRQQMHTVSVVGSARTEAALKVAHASASLGEVTVYTFPDDGRNYSPPLRQFATAATAAAATVDAATVSGARNMLDTAAQFDVPSDRLYRGRHLIVSRLRGSVTADTSVQFYTQMLLGSTALAGQGSRDDPVTVDLRVTEDWQWFILGAVDLPMVDVGGTATQRVSIVDPDVAGVDIDVDEVLLANLSIGALTQVACDTGTAVSGGPSRCLFIEPPTVDVPRPRLLRGHATDMSDAFYPGTQIAAWGSHEFKGGEDVKILTITTGTTGAVTSGRYYPRHYTHATV